MVYNSFNMRRLDVYPKPYIGMLDVLPRVSTSYGLDPRSSPNLKENKIKSKPIFYLKDVQEWALKYNKLGLI